MHLLLVVAVLAALVLAESSPAQPVSGAPLRLSIAVAGVALVGLFAALSSHIIARQLQADFARWPRLLRRFSQIRRVHLVLWLMVAVGTAYGLDWGQLVRFNWNLDRAFLLDDLLILAPVVLPLVLSWSAFYEVERALRFGLAGGESLEAKLSSRRQYLVLHTRHYLGLLLLPVLGLLAVQDVCELLWPGLLEGRYAAAVALPVLVLLFLLFPVMLRCIWETWPLAEGSLRGRLRLLAQRAGLPARQILVWFTDGMMANAAVAGVAPGLRYVFLTDGLLARLDVEEVESVFAHELGHVYHRHLFLRMAAMFVPLSLWMMFDRLAPGAMTTLQEALNSGGVALQAQGGLLMILALLAYVLLVFGSYSRILESQADLFACRLTGGKLTEESIRPFRLALEKLSEASGSRNARSWQHHSTTRRLEFLQEAARNPNRELRFQRRVRFWNCLTLAALVIPLVVGLLADSWKLIG